VVADSGVSCPRCGAAPRCARAHAWRHRRRVRDLAAGRVFADVPVVRVVLCTGATISLMPAALWRGRSTIASVVTAVGHVLADGIEAGPDWVRIQVHGEPGVSRSTLGRWRDKVLPRVSAAALAVVEPHPTEDWSRAAVAARMALLGGVLTLAVLASFRTRCGRAVLDRPAPRSSAAPRRSVRPIPGRLFPAPPPATGGPRLRRGTWSHATPRGPPREVREEETTDDCRPGPAPTTRPPRPGPHDPAPATGRCFGTG